MLATRNLGAAGDLLALQRLAPVRYPLLLESSAAGTAQGRWDILLAASGESLASTTSTVPTSATASPIHVRSVSRSRSQNADTAAVAAGTSEIRIEAVPLAIRVSA